MTHAYTEANRAYLEAFRFGIKAAHLIDREHANRIAHAKPAREGDAFLAGYYAQLRALRREQEEETYRRDMIEAGRGRLLR